MAEIDDIQVQQDNVVQSPLNKSIKDRFLLVLKLPDALQNKLSAYVKGNRENGIVKESLQWSVKRVNVPKDAIKTQAIPYAGGNMYISTHTKDAYDMITFNLKVDNKFKNYLTAYEWMNLIQNEYEAIYDAAHLTENLSAMEYATNLKLIALDEYNNHLVSWTFTHAFPVEISELELDYESTDEMDLNITFAFSQKFVTHLDTTENIK